MKEKQFFLNLLKKISNIESWQFFRTCVSNSKRTVLKFLISLLREFGKSGKLKLLA